MRALFLEFGRRGPVPGQIDDAVVHAGTLPPDLTDSFARYSPRYRYDAASIDAALSGLPPSADGSRLLRYVNPVTAGPVMPTLDCYALRLRAGAATRASRSTSNAVAVVARGAGRSRVGDKTISWRKNDVFTLPHWNWISHVADEADSQLFLMTDRSLLDAMGYLRTEFEDKGDQP